MCENNDNYLHILIQEDQEPQAPSVPFSQRIAGTIAGSRISAIASHLQFSAPFYNSFAR